VVYVEVRNAPEELAALQKRLKAAGERGLRRELFKGLNRAAKPPQAAARRNAARLPKRGGYAARVATAKMSVKTKAGREPAIRLMARAGAKRVDLYAADAGLIRHPVFGRPKSWVGQRVRPGWWTDALKETAPQARQEMEAALDRVAAQVDGKGRFGGSTVPVT
jgi:hypothetical protein